MIANIKRYAMRNIKLKTMGQQTAVEWLIEQLQAPCRGIPSHIVEQAKQMEKEQIIQAFDIACEDADRIGEEYYNETYKKQ